MPLNPQPFRSDDLAHPDQVLPSFKERSSQVDSAPSTAQSRTPQPLLPGIDVTHPLFKVAMVAFIGYTLGRLIHGGK